MPGQSREQSAEDVQRQAAPHPDDSRKPDQLTEIAKPSWRFAIKRSFREFMDDECTDLAAALTYYAVLALFPALIAMVSLLGVFGQGQKTIDALLSIAGDLAPKGVVDTLQGPITGLVQNKSAGIGLIIGLVIALWSASGYVSAFSRAMNRIYEIQEGRPFWKLRPLQMVITLAAVVLIGLIALGLVVSGQLARAIGSVIGLGDAAVTAWQIAKWPVLVLLVIIIIAVLYWATPNIKQPKFRWMSPGAFIALIIWVLASVGFGLYVANFGSYQKTYGALAGVIVFLLWLWITNLALLFGAEFDSELERTRELQAGMRAEAELQLPARDTSGIEKRVEREQKAKQEAREIRLDAVDEHVEARASTGGPDARRGTSPQSPED
ncbi:MAG TPA: YihY/virulence factor BrkB family protein [Actinomycetales bacterium]|nr:YihY/virulence factor BrkB family protein [Actinomycetales bacterium]